MAPPAYGIDFLDHQREPERDLGDIAAPASGRAVAASTRDDNKPSRSPLRHRTGKRHSSESRQEQPIEHEPWPMLRPRQMQERPPLATVGKKEAGEAEGSGEAATRGHEAVFPFRRERPLPGKAIAQVLSIAPERPLAGERRAIDFRIAAQPAAVAELAAASSAAADKPRFQLNARSVPGKSALPPARAEPALGSKTGPASPRRLSPVPPLRQAQAKRPATAAAIARPAFVPTGAASPTAEPAADAGLPAREGSEELTEATTATPIEEETWGRIDATGTQTTDPVDSSEAASESEERPQTVAEAPPPLPVADSVENVPLSAAPPTTSDGDISATPAAAASEQAAPIPRAEQAAQARGARESAPEPADEPALQQLGAGTEAGREGGAASGLSSSEQSTALATVGEDAGGGEASPAHVAESGGGTGREEPASETQAPDTAGMSPEAGLATAAVLPVGATQKALAGVASAADSSLQQEARQLQQEMPAVDVGEEGGNTPAATLAVAGEATRIQRARTTAVSLPVAAPRPLPEPPPSPMRNIPTPQVSDGAEGSLSAADAQQMQSSIQTLPTTDPGLVVPVGPPPTLQLSGTADPTQIADQRDKLSASILAQRAQGAAEMAAPAGENDIGVHRRKERLKIPPLAIAASATAAAPEPVDETIAIIAEQHKGAEVRTAVSRAQDEIAGKRAEHQLRVVEEQNTARQQIHGLQMENASQANAARVQVKRDVVKARADWGEEQQQEITKADEKVESKLSEGNVQIAREQARGDQQALQHIAEGEREALRHKHDAESAAAAKKKGAAGESQGLFGWAAAKASAFFDRLKQGLVEIFAAARRLLRAAIEEARKLAAMAIERARTAIISVIRTIGDALIAIGSELLAVFPGLRAKWRGFIESKVKAAQDLVDRLADALKRNLQKLLDTLGKASQFMLDLHQQGMMMILDVARSVTTRAIKFASSVATGLGGFLILVKDIAQNPGQWVLNLGAAIRDGVRNHLWQTFSDAVKRWFNEKIDEVLGLGTLIWDTLRKGGIALKQVGEMVWKALKAAIPSALIGILIEKLVAMIVPAAGAVMIIIEGVRAAWGSIQRILAAIGKFIEFLKAVKTGRAGPQFATMLAAAAVVAIDFVANWLIRKLRRPASKVGGRIKAIAQRIMARTKAVAKKVGGWAKGKVKKLTKKFGDWRNKHRTKKDRNKKGERIERAKRELPGKIKQFLARKPGRLHLLTQLLIWRIQYRLKYLRITGPSNHYRIEGQINPTLDLAPGWSFEQKDLLAAVDRIAQRMIDEAKKEQPAPGEQAAENETLDLARRQEPAKGVVALAPESDFTVGETVSGVRIGYSHSKKHAPWPGPSSANWQGVAAVGETGKGHLYPDIGQGLSDQQTGELMAKILRRERIPDLPESQAKLLGEMHGLWFAKEPSHSKGKHRRDLVYSLMVTELMTQGEGGKVLSTRQGISLHPASFGGAQAGAKRVTREMHGKSGWSGAPLSTEEAKKRREKIDKATRKRKGRELGTIKLWFRRHANNLPQLDRPATIADVEAFVEARIREFIKQQPQVTS